MIIIIITTIQHNHFLTWLKANIESMHPAAFLTNVVNDLWEWLQGVGFATVHASTWALAALILQLLHVLLIFADHHFGRLFCKFSALFYMPATWWTRIWLWINYTYRCWIHYKTQQNNSLHCQVT